MNDAAKPPPRPWDVAQATAEAEHSRAGREAQSPELAENAAPKPGASLGVMIGVVLALLLAAILAWVVLGQSGVS